MKKIANSQRQTIVRPKRYLKISIATQTLELVRPLSKLADAHQVQGAYGTQPKSVYRIRDEASTEATQQFAAAVELTNDTFMHVTSYPISSSKFGLGAEPDSNKTPVGNFLIEEKIGDGASERTIFKSRKSTDNIAPLGGEEDLILSRILWLGGLDVENRNTRDRFIYIHGTNQEELIGTPASHGCIRMRNNDVIELFNSVEVGDVVEIVSFF